MHSTEQLSTHSHTCVWHSHSTYSTFYTQYTALSVCCSVVQCFAVGFYCDTVLRWVLTHIRVCGTRTQHTALSALNAQRFLCVYIECILDVHWVSIQSWMHKWVLHIHERALHIHKRAPCIRKRALYVTCDIYLDTSDITWLSMCVCVCVCVCVCICVRVPWQIRVMSS